MSLDAFEYMFPQWTIFIPKFYWWNSIFFNLYLSMLNVAMKTVGKSIFFGLSQSSLFIIYLPRCMRRSFIEIQWKTSHSVIILYLSVGDIVISSKLCHFFQQVIEEARRVLMISEGECQDFMRKCVLKLTEEIEFLIYYGINSKGINPPRSPQLSKFLCF